MNANERPDDETIKAAVEAPGFLGRLVVRLSSRAFKRPRYRQQAGYCKFRDYVPVPRLPYLLKSTGLYSLYLDQTVHCRWEMKSGVNTLVTCLGSDNF